MSNNKTKYTIYSDRIYVLEYEDFKAEVLGEEILAALRRDKYLDYILESEIKPD